MAQPSTFHLEQFLVHAFHVGELDAGRRVADILDGRTMVGAIEERFRGNRAWYSQSLDDMVPLERSQITVPPAFDDWTNFNPCVASDGGTTLLVNLRSSNYRIRDDGSYDVISPDGIIRTANQILRVGHDLLPAAPAWTWPDPSPRGSKRGIHGIEDCRFAWDAQSKSWRVSGTVCGPPDPGNPWGMREIGTLRLRPGSAEPVTDFVVRPPAIAGRHEKNWMPVEGRNDVWLYSCWEDEQTCAAVVNGDGWQLNKVGPAPAAARHFRGGSQLVNLGARGFMHRDTLNPWYLAVVHEVLPGDNGKRVYEHRFVTFDRELRITGYSQPWWINGSRQIEFVAGAAVVADKGARARLVISYGVNDCEAWLAACDLNDALDMCVPVATPEEAEA